MLVTEYWGLNDDHGAVVSIILSWIILPMVMLKIWPEKPDLECLAISKDEPIVQEYVELSKSEVSRFVEGLSNGLDEALIKFPHKFDGEVEYVWGVAHSITNNDLIITSLASDPVGSLNNEDYARIQIPLDDIHDWMLINHEGEIKGGYSHIAMIKVYERDHGKVPKRYIKSLENFIDLKEMIDR